MKVDFVVLGATGDQGRICSKDLLQAGYTVLLAGRNPDPIQDLLKNKKASFMQVDVRDIKKTAKVIKDSGAKIVLNCVELTWNIEVMKACLLANAHYLDLGGLQEMTIKQYKLEREFKKRKLLALLGCGSTPGIANVMAKHAVEQFDKVDHIDLGFAWDSNIKEFVIPYSIESIVYELTTPAIVLEKGKFKKSKACYFEGTNKFRGVGLQNLYCIVHSEVYTFHKYFKKMGLKNVHYTAGFPEHSHRVIKFLIDLGFSSKEEITVKGTPITILDFTREVLKKKKHPKNYEETENVWVKVTGVDEDMNKTIMMECLTTTLKGYEEAGSNINTGMSISIMGQLFLKGKIDKIGILAPEACVPSQDFFEELAKRKMFVYQDGKKIN
ncbi:MAG: saccharopine dehydrogenase C-terminal domain-containing protein [Candidatus Nanoarchaeia archaeon]